MTTMEKHPDTIGAPVEPQEPPRTGPMRPYRVYDELWLDNIRYKLQCPWFVTSFDPPTSIGPDYVVADDPADPDMYRPDAEFLTSAEATRLSSMARFVDGKAQTLEKYGPAMAKLAMVKEDLRRIMELLA